MILDLFMKMIDFAEVPVPSMNEIRVGHTSFMTKEHWDNLGF